MEYVIAPQYKNNQIKDNTLCAFYTQNSGYIGEKQQGQRILQQSEQEYGNVIRIDRQVQNESFGQYNQQQLYERQNNHFVNEPNVYFNNNYGYNQNHNYNYNHNQYTHIKTTNGSYMYNIQMEQQGQQGYQTSQTSQTSQYYQLKDNFNYDNRKLQEQQNQYYSKQMYGSIYNPYHKNINPNYY